MDKVTDWPRRIGMLCRDGSPAIEKARRECLPYARPLSDFPHFSRHIYARAKKWKALKNIVYPFYSATMQAPTVELFSAVWQLFRTWLDAEIEYRSFYTYLFKKSMYFADYTVDQMSRWPCMALHSRSNGVLLWSPVHRGIFSIIPGSGSGEQPIESFHKGSMGPMSAATNKGAPVTAAVTQLESAYPIWNASMGWSASTALSLYASPATSIYSGLSRLGRSSPHDFWHNRFNGNHYIITVGDTCFVAMHSLRSDIVDPLPAMKQMTEAPWHIEAVHRRVVPFRIMSSSLDMSPRSE